MGLKVTIYRVADVSIGTSASITFGFIEKSFSVFYFFYVFPYLFLSLFIFFFLCYAVF